MTGMYVEVDRAKKSVRDLTAAVDEVQKAITAFCAIGDESEEWIGGKLQTTLKAAHVVKDRATQLTATTQEFEKAATNFIVKADEELN